MSSTTAHWVKGKRILVTRPGEQARGLVAALNKLGATPLELPVIDIQPLADAEVERDKIIDLDQFDAVILVSVNAARYALKWLDRYWPQLPPHLKWYAVGNATAGLLAAEGIAASSPDGEYNSEALLRVPGLLAVENDKILIVKGVGGRDLLHSELAQRGARVQSLALYRRGLPAFSAADIDKAMAGKLPDALLATSIDALHNLDQLLLRIGNTHYPLPLVVASARIAREARLKGFTRVVEAKGAADECILQALNVIG